MTNALFNNTNGFVSIVVESLVKSLNISDVFFIEICLAIPSISESSESNIPFTNTILKLLSIE